MRRLLSAAALLVVGMASAFFFVFNALFSDGPASPLDAEYLVVYTLIIGVYALAAFGAIRWGGWGWWGLAWLTTPGLLVILLYAEPSWRLRALVALALVVGNLAGAWLGKRRRRAARTAPS